MYISYPIVHAVKRVKGLSFPQKSVLYTLSFYAQKDGSIARISDTQIAEEAGEGKKATRKSVVNAIHKLIEKGYLEEAEDNKKGCIKGYRFNLEKLGLPVHLGDNLDSLDELGNLDEGLQNEIENIRNSVYTADRYKTLEQFEQDKEDAIQFILNVGASGKG